MPKSFSLNPNSSFIWCPIFSYKYLFTEWGILFRTLAIHGQDYRATFKGTRWVDTIILGYMGNLVRLVQPKRFEQPCEKHAIQILKRFCAWKSRECRKREKVRYIITFKYPCEDRFIKRLDWGERVRWGKWYVCGNG